MLTALCLSLLAPQELRPEPFPAQVGVGVTVRAVRRDEPVGALPVRVRLPSGDVTACGVTDADGALQFVPEQVGHHVFEAQIDGVRVLAPLPVTPVRRSWWAAFALVPLGLVLGWWNVRRLVRQAKA